MIWVETASRTRTPYATMSTCRACICLLLLPLGGPTRDLLAQCPDGTPPPCSKHLANQRSALIVRRDSTGLARVTVTYDNVPLQVVLAEFSRVSARSLLRSVAVDTLRFSGRFEDEPWDRALFAVCERYELFVRVLSDGALKIETPSEKTARESTEPLETRYIRLQSARASEMLPLLQGAVSNRGRLVADSATNSLVLTEITSRIAAVEAFVRGLDTTRKAASKP